MSAEHVEAGEVDEAEEVLDVIFPSGNESAEVVHPGEEPLHFPSSLVAPQLASVLRLSAPAPVGRDQLDAVRLFELLIESVRVVGFVSDELFGEFIEETSGEDLFDKLAFVGRSALDRYGERKTVISGDSDDLRPLAAPGGADGKPPFFALAKVASTNASSRLSLPCSRRCRARSLRAPSSFPDRTHCWNRRWQVWYGGYFSGNSRHCAPVPSTHNTPFNTARRSGRSTGSTTSHCSSVNSQRPAIGACGDTQSIHRMPLFTTGNVYETGSSGAAIVGFETGKTTMQTTHWDYESHNAQEHGKSIIKALIPGRDFDFPKSLYAVEDALCFFIKGKENATVLDFFSGSGTTAHAVMRLNKQHGGRRQCISGPNNEVSADEQRARREKGLRPGDAEWERWGICEYITKPRVEAAITGKTPDGEPIKGDYKFTDEFPMADGFEENAEFFTLTYETPLSVNHNIAFARIAPLLWLRAGSRGKRIDKLPEEGWAVVDTYGLLSDVDNATPFIRAMNKAKDLRIAYVVTDDDRRFQAIARRLPEGVAPVRLYESYLTNFSFANGD